MKLKGIITLKVIFTESNGSTVIEYWEKGRKVDERNVRPANGEENDATDDQEQLTEDDEDEDEQDNVEEESARLDQYIHCLCLWHNDLKKITFWPLK